MNALHTAEGQLSVGQLLLQCSASSLSSKKCLQNNCPKCWMRPLVASLYSAKWMYFTPFELRKVWSFSDINWAPLSLSSPSGIPYPVNSVLVWTGEREFHNGLWPFSRGNKSTNDYMQNLGRPLSTFAICLAHIRISKIFMFYLCYIRKLFFSWYYLQIDPNVIIGLTISGFVFRFLNNPLQGSQSLASTFFSE